MAQAKQDLQAIINDAAAREGVDPELMQKIGGSESSLKASAKNPKSTAKGLFQFVDATWKEMGGKPGQQYDPQKNAELGAKYVKKNVQALAQSLGREPSHGEVYAAHVFGTTGAKTLLTKADPNAPIEKSLAMFESPKRVAKVLKQNPNLRGKTTAQVLADLDKKMGGQKPQTMAGEPSPTPTPEKKPFNFFRSPVPHFIRSEAPNLGTGYNAALALMGISDDDELTKAQETVARNEEENSVADFGQAKQMLASVTAPNAFANRQPTRMMAKGGEVQKYADGGFAVPFQQNIYRPEDKKYLDEQMAAWDQYNAQANEYNRKLAEYQGSAPVKQYASAAEAYNEKLKEYNATQWEPYKAQVDEYNRKLEQFNQSPEYQTYQQQVNDYNAALGQYQRDVYDPYKSQVDQYNAGLEQFQNTTYRDYVNAANEYNRQVEAYNAIPTRVLRERVFEHLARDNPAGYTWVRNPAYIRSNLGDVVGKDPFTQVAPTQPTYNATAPTAPTPFGMQTPTEVKFGEVQPTKPADFTIAPPTAPAGFGVPTPTQPTESINAVMARRAQADQIAAKDAEQRGIALQAANNPNQFNLAGFGAAGINAPTIALMAKGGEAKKSDHDTEAEKLFDDFLSVADQRLPIDASLMPSPPSYVEGLGLLNMPPSVGGRVGTNFNAAGGNVRVGASGMAMQTPDKKIMTMPGMYDIGYSTQQGPHNLDLSFQKEIKAMPGREKNYAINARYKYEFAEGGEVAPEPEKGSAKAMLKEIGRSTQYAPADIAGSPVDLINLGLKGVDAMTGSKLAQELPVGGAEWLIKKANEYGLMDKPTGSTTENLTRMGMGIVSPTAGPRAMVAAGKAIKGTAKAALEDLAMAGTGQGGSKIAQGVAKATGMEPAFVVPPSQSKKALQELDVSMIRPSDKSPFVGRLEQTLFDNPQDVFTPQQLLGWAKKNLPGQDADRLQKAAEPLMGQKRITKQELLEAVNTTYSPRQFTLEITKPNEPIRGNPYHQTYPGEDFPYIGASDVKSTGLIVAKKPAQEIGQLRLEGALESIASHNKALDNYLSGVDTKTAPGNLMNVKNYIQNLAVDEQTKKQGANLLEQFANTNQSLANSKQVEKYFSKYLTEKPDLDQNDQIKTLDQIAESLGLDTTLLRPEQVEQDIRNALFAAQRYGAQETGLARDQLKQFIQGIAPEEHRFFTGRHQHEFQGANALGFSRYADISVDGKNMIGISELQSDLRRNLKENRASPTGKASRQAEAIEMFPNMEKRPEVITQNLIKNSIYAAAKMDKDGLVLPGMMSKKPELYTSVNKHAKAALKDMGLDTSYLKRIDPTKVYDKNILEERMISHYNNNIVDTGNEVYQLNKIPYEEQQYLLDYFSPYVIYLPKKERKSIIQYGIPYKNGGMVDKNDDENQKYL